MKCPSCKSEVELRSHSRFVYEAGVFGFAGGDLEAVLGSCPRCRAPVILLRRGKSVEMDGMVEMSEIDSEEICYPSP
jgi:hypothetical protein